MNISSPGSRPCKLLLASGIALAIAMMTTGAMAGEVTDARQESQIWTAYSLSPYLHANDLTVSVANGKATLAGTVEEDVSKELAREIAMGVDGITEVDNTIVIQPDYVPAQASANSTFVNTIEDASITAAIKSKLLWSKNADGMSSKVETKAGRVTLSGTVASAADRDFAGRLAANTRGVSTVNNQLEVDAKKTTGAANGKGTDKQAGTEIADSWITTKVKSTLLYSSNVSGSDIEVNTSKGIVTLRGKVGNGSEQALAIELAQNVRGVKSVQAKELTF
ncbi:transporter [Stutzerimonas kirkiae]|uniref:Transporter n=1 Tax=Stutzerimonas kirkiae TaxID=2211392 RepID=A0A4Q9R0P1_9GAMM|nr:BON domain-containing protein [Stutzerimonas kirkiae]TBU92023.1 transporter [Stutzerimonas kirkiae]TBU98437.1 transporter [Stutzerimonas kirkiae]